MTTILRAFRLSAPILLVAAVLFANVPPVFAAVSFGTAASASATTNLVIAKPTSTAVGDFLIAAVTFNGGTNTTITAPVGWSLVLRTDNSNDVGIATYRKFATASEPASYTFVIDSSSTERAAGGIQRYTGVDSTNPVDVSLGSVGSDTSGTINITASSVNTTVVNTVVLAFFAQDNNSAGISGYTPTTGSLTERFDVSHADDNGPSISGVDFTQAVAGATTARVATVATGDDGFIDNIGGPSVSQTIALRPAKIDQAISFGALANKTYGDANFVVSATGGASGNPVTFSSQTAGVCTTSGTNGTTVHIVAQGTCTVRASQAGNASYNAAPDVDQSFTVAKKTVTPTVTLNNKIYDGTTAATTIATRSLSGVVVPDDVNLGSSGTVAAFSSKNVGPYTPTVSSLALTGTTAGNYVLSTTSVNPSASITTKTASVSPNASSKTYGAADPAFTGTLTGFIVGDGISATYSRTTGENVVGSPYTISAVLTPSGALTNYTITYNIANFTINKANQTITFAALADKTYGNADFGVTATSDSGLTVSFGASGNCSVTGATVHITGAGSCTITASQAGDGNYNAATSIPRSFTINKANANITVDGYSGTYDAAAHGATGSAIGVNLEDLSSLLHLGSSFTNVAGGTANWTFDGNSNYNSANGSVAITINKADAVCDVTAYSDTYDGATHTADGLCKGVQDETLVGLDLSGTTHTNAGTYNNDPWTYTDVSGNYNDTNGTVNDAIAKVEIAVTADPQTKIYGETDPALTYQFTPALISGDSFSGNVARVIGENVGPYVIGQGNLALSANYNIVFTPGTFTITNREVEVTADADQSKEYGQTDPTFSYSITDGTLASGDSFIGALSRDTGESVNLYPITKGTLAINDNYTLTFVSNDFGITKKSASVTPAANSKTYGDADPAFSGSLSGFLTGDNVTATYTRTSGETVVGSPYIISATLDPVDVLDNYQITYNTANFTINAADQVIDVTTHAPANATYNTHFDVEASSDSGLDVAITTSGVCSGTGSNPATVTMTSGTGTCTVHYNQGGDSNFNAATEVTEEVTGEKETQTIDFTDPSDKHFGDADFALVATGGASGNPVTFTSDTTSICTVSGSTAHIVTVGTCTITAHQAGDSNYSAAGDVQQSLSITDNIKPIITRTGGAVINLGTGDSYTDAGATALDDVDGDITANIVTTGTVNTAIPDTYTIHYNVSDAALNAADEVTRSVIVADDDAPVITLSGLTPITIEVHTPYSDAGATAVDNVDPSVTVTTTGSVDVDVVGDYVLTYSAEDAAHNVALEITRTVHVVDTTDPTITLNGSADVVVELHGSYTDAGAVAHDNYDADTPVTAAGSVDTETVGDYVLTYDFTDANNNAAAQVARTVHVTDTTAPIITIDPYNTLPTNLDVTVNAHTNEGTLNADSHVFTANGSFDFVATDASDNAATTTVTISNIDKTAPETAINNPKPTDPTSNPDATFTFSSDDGGATFTCQLDSDAAASCDSGVAYLGLSDDTHTFIVYATDAVGNTDPTPAEFTWTVDTQAPTVAITSGPQDPTATEDTTPTFEFDVSDGTITCAIDGDTPVSCDGSFTAISSLTDGSHTFTVQATDAAGNTGSDSRTFTVDTQGPVVTITSPLSTDTTGSSGTITYIIDDAVSVVCTQDGPSVPCDIGGSKSFGPLGSGSHTFTVQGTDSLGNPGEAASVTWTVDATGPDVSILSGPSEGEVTETNSGSFTFTAEGGATFMCTLDTDAEADCSSPFNFGPLDDGPHSFAIHATDTYGNAGGQVIRNWEVDATPPTITNDVAADATTDSITITWDTDHAATSRVVWDSVSGSHEPVTNTTCSSPSTGDYQCYGYVNTTDETDTGLSMKTTGHSVTISGLSAGTTYHLRAVSHGSPEGHGDDIVVTTDEVVVPPTLVHVIIAKFIDDAHATAENANSATFTMQADYSFTNDAFPSGITGSDPYTLSTVGNLTDTAYEAKTLEFYAGANYATHEHTDDDVVGTSCESGKPFALVGYSIGDTMEEAVGAPVLTDAPSFTNLQGNKFVIVHNHKCAVVVPPTSVSVHIAKYIDNGGANHATAGNTDSASFPMFATANSVTYGNFVDAPFTLDENGWSGDPAYEASFPNANVGADYAARENLSTAVVGASCDGTHQYALVGYTVGTSFADAAGKTPSLTSPSFTNLQSDQYVIVWNHKCGEVEGTTTIKVHVYKYLDGEQATAATADNYQFPMTATWQTANLDGGVSTSGDYVLGNNHGGAAEQYGADTSPMEVPADYTTHEITNDVNGDSLVLPIGGECSAGKFRLVGYSTGTTFEAALAASKTNDAPVFTDIEADQYVIVWDEKCGDVVEPETGTIVIEKHTDDEDNNGTFTFAGLNNASITTTDGAGTQTFENLAAGAYSISEDAQTGWTLDNASCTNGDDQTDIDPSQITLGAGQTITCIFNNSKNVPPTGNGKLIVIKKTIGANGTFSMDGGNVLGTFNISTFFHWGVKVLKNIPAGSYSVSETVPSGWSQISNSCTNVNVTANHVKVCIIVNKKVNTPPANGTLIVKKFVKNDNGGTKHADDFSFSVNGGDATAFEADGSNSISVTPGTYNVTEVADPGYSASYYSCSNIHIAAGQTKTCLIKNNDKKGTLTVIKHVINDNDGTKDADDFTLKVSGSHVSKHSFKGSETGKTVSLNAGTYSVTEPNSKGYTSTFSDECSGTIALGEHKTCIVTNDDPESGDTGGDDDDIPTDTTATLIITKDSGDNDGSFTFDVTGHDSVVVTTEEGMGSSEAVTLDPGSYDVSETLPDGWNYDGAICEVGEDNVGSDLESGHGESITVAAGDEVTCTFTNTKEDDGDDEEVPANTPPVITLNGSGTINLTTGAAYSELGATVTDAEDNPDPIVVIDNSAVNTSSAGSYVVTYNATDLGGLHATEVTRTVVVTDPAPVEEESVVGGGGGTGDNPGGSTPPGFVTFSFAGTSGGSVLGAATSTVPITAPVCSTPLLTTYMKKGKHNDPDEVKKLQNFLNGELGLNIPLTGYFGLMTESAVNQFQVKYFEDVLNPWVIHGLPTNTTPTGYVFKTTQRKINLIYCSQLDIPMPQL